MKLFIVILLMSMAVWAGVWIAQDPGYLMIIWQQTRIDLPLWLGVLLLFLSVYALYVLLHFLGVCLHLPSNTAHWWKEKRLARIRRRTIRGYLALLEGRFREAEHLLMQGSHPLHTAVINFLCAATAADKQGKIATRDEYLRLAHRADKRADLAIGITQARLQMDSKQWEQSLATLRRLQQVAPDHDFIWVLLEPVLIELKDWKGLIALLPELKKRKLIADAKYQSLCELAYGNALSQAADAQKPELWASIPAYFQTQASILVRYLPFLLQSQQVELAEQLMRTSLNQHWDHRIVRYYGRFHLADLHKQIKTAEHWLKKYPDDPVLLLTLGRLYTMEGIWGQAQASLEHSTRIKADPEAFWVLAHVYTQLKDPDAARLAFEKGLKIVVEEVSS